jgi:uncharacterized protein YfiM (DUF2279 family)
MAFKIPNLAQATYVDLAEPDSIDIDILVAAYNSTGVISGCAVTAQASPNMTVAVASGTVIVGGTRGTVTGANVTITTADGANPRIDLIVSNGSGTLSATAGTAAVEPVMPAIPSTSVVLAIVYMPAADTTISGSQIIDKRVINPISVSQLANGTDGELITWDASGVPATVAVGTSTHVLTSNGVGVAPTFQAAAVSYSDAQAISAVEGESTLVLSGVMTATSPVLTTPNLGTPSAGVMTNATGTAASLTAGNVTTNANLTGHVTSVGNAAVLGSFTSAQLATALTNETGSGAAVFGTSPTLVTPALGTPASGVMTNATGTATGLTSGITNALKSATTTVSVSAASAPTSGQVLTATAGTTATWQTTVPVTQAYAFFIS